MATWYEIQRKNHERDRYLNARGLLSKPEPPLFFTGGRGRAFGRRPVSIPTIPQPGPASESPEGVEERE